MKLKLYPKLSIALVIGLAPFVAAQPSYAADPGTGWVCTPGHTQSGGVGTCTNNGGGGGNGNGGGGSVNHDWDPMLPAPGDGPCISNGVPSWLSPLYNHVTGEVLTVQTHDDGTVGEPCVGQAGNGGTIDEQKLKERAKVLIKIPVPVANYQGDFLTGAPVTFTVPDAKDTWTQAIPEVPGATLLAKPKTDFSWDFADGQTGAGDKVEHTYQTTVPDSNKPDDHKVEVSVSRTWNLYITQPNADPDLAVQNFGTITLTSALNPPRTIVQVWAAQTEPNS